MRQATMCVRPRSLVGHRHIRKGLNLSLARLQRTELPLMQILALLGRSALPKCAVGVERADAVDRHAVDPVGDVVWGFGESSGFPR